MSAEADAGEQGEHIAGVAEQMTSVHGVTSLLSMEPEPYCASIITGDRHRIATGTSQKHDAAVWCEPVGADAGELLLAKRCQLTHR